MDKRGFKVGDVVLDELTYGLVTILRIEKDGNGNIGYWVDSDFLDGGRHPWEISKPKDKEDTK